MKTIEWDLEDIWRLGDELSDLSEDEIENLDWSDLPSMPFPEWFDTTEVWAMDKHGGCLIGLISDGYDQGFQYKSFNEILKDRKIPSKYFKIWEQFKKDNGFYLLG